jgi:hypothetical protein
MESIYYYDEGRSGFITFIQLRKILERLNINLSTKLAEYIIYVMKNFGTTDDGVSIYDLKYINLFKIIDETEKNIKDEPVKQEEPEEESDEDSGIEISPEEYIQITDKVLYKIAIKTQFNPDKFFKSEISKIKGNEAIALPNFLNIMLEAMKVELNDVEIYCIFNRFKLDEDNDEDDNMNYSKLKAEILSKKRLNFDLTHKIKLHLEEKKKTFEDFIQPIESNIKDGFIDINQFKNFIVKKNIMDWDDNLLNVNSDTINENLLFRDNMINVNYLKHILTDENRNTITKEEIKSPKDDVKR